MSESDTQISMGAVATASANSTAAQPPPTATSQAADVPDDASSWAMAGADVPAVAQGLDQVSGNSGSDDWFPSVAVTGVIAMALAIEPDIDPLVSLPDNAIVVSDGGHSEGASPASVTQAASSLDLPNAETHVSALDILSMPIDHGTPLDHIEWHFSGLLPLV